MLSPSSLSTANRHPSRLKTANSQRVPSVQPSHDQLAPGGLAALCYNLHRRGALASWLLSFLAELPTFLITPVLKLSTQEFQEGGTLLHLAPDLLAPASFVEMLSRCTGHLDGELGCPGDALASWLLLYTTSSASSKLSSSLLKMSY